MIDNFNNLFLIPDSIKARQQRENHLMMLRAKSKPRYICDKLLFIIFLIFYDQIEPTDFCQILSKSVSCLYFVDKWPVAECSQGFEIV